MILEVLFDDDYLGCIQSKVYSIDSVRDRFLIIDKDGWFKWVSTKDCRMVGYRDEWEDK